MSARPSSFEVRFMPTLTLQEIARWCAANDLTVRVSYTIKDDDLVPVVVADLPQSAAPEPDEWRVGVAWWNSLSEHERAQALLLADSRRPLDAWRVWRRSQGSAR